MGIFPAANKWHRIKNKYHKCFVREEEEEVETTCDKNCANNHLMTIKLRIFMCLTKKKSQGYKTTNDVTVYRRSERGQ